MLSELHAHRPHIMRHGSQIDPPNRFGVLHTERDLEQLADQPDAVDEIERRAIEYLDDQSQSIVTENNSPDIPFRYSVNPYRGCVHGCSYCYARNSHEYLGLNAGLDFETKIFVKRDAPKLLRDFLARDSWRGEPIMFSGVTDCYQPAERELKITRQCLELASECNQPIGIVTKNALVARDRDVLASLAERNLAYVYFSITSLEEQLARDMEPRTSTPAAKLRAMKQLAEAGVPVGVMIAPVVPGLNDHEIPAILQTARENGAIAARYLMLRLPFTVEPVFREWLTRTQPTKQAKVESYLRSIRDGKLNSSQFGERHVGTGELATQIRNLFRLFHNQRGYGSMPKLDSSHFTPAIPRSGQQRLF